MTKIQGGGGSIAYRQTATQCQALRQAAGRWGTDLLPLQAQARAQTPWLSAAALEPATKGGPSALQRQSVQALCQILAATVETATAVARWRGGAAPAAPGGNRLRPDAVSAPSHCLPDGELEGPGAADPRL